MPFGRGDDFALADVERALAEGPRSFRFAPAIEARFEADTGVARCRRFIAASLIGLAFYDLSVVSDYTMMPDVIGDIVIVKLAVVTPLILLAMFVLTRNPAPWLREIMVAGLATAILASSISLILRSASPLAAHAHYPALLSVLFANLILRARFRYAFVASIASFVIYTVGVAHIASMPPQALAHAVVAMAMTVTCTLYANFMLESDERRAYLGRLRGEIRRQQLVLANKELSLISNLDALTGLANRRGLNDYIEAICHRARTIGQSVAVLMIDVDHFKRFNDCYGHQAGDACLKHIAETARLQLRRGDEMIARFGGEEFVVVIPGADILDGIRMGERIRRAIEARPIRYEATPLKTATVSIGVAAAPTTTEASPAALIQAADAALYEAKNRGRNRVWPPIMASDAETMSAALAPSTNAVIERVA